MLDTTMRMLHEIKTVFIWPELCSPQSHTSLVHLQCGYLAVEPFKGVMKAKNIFQFSYIFIDIFFETGPVFVSQASL